MMHILIPALLCLSGVGILITAIIATVHAKVSTGLWLTYLLGAAFLAGGLWFSHLPLWLIVMCGIGLLAVGGCIAWLFAVGKADTVTHREDAIVVLGASMKDDKPTKCLQNRLDRAAALYARNPAALIVVSGAASASGTVTEADAMEGYLLERGIPSAAILKEDKAVNTKENFLFTKPLLEQHLDGAYTAVFVTSDYHVYRSVQNAAFAAFRSMTHAHSNSPWYMILPNGLRECLAICKMWLFQYRR